MNRGRHPLVRVGRLFGGLLVGTTLFSAIALTSVVHAGATSPAPALAGSVVSGGLGSTDVPDPDVVTTGGTTAIFSTRSVSSGESAMAIPEWTTTEEGGGSSWTTSSVAGGGLPISGVPTWANQLPPTLEAVAEAPGAFKIGSTWFLYFAASPTGQPAGDYCIGVATSASVTGPFGAASEPVLCEDGSDGFPNQNLAVIDPSPFYDPATGANWLLFKTNTFGGTSSEIWAAPLSGSGLGVGTPRSVFTGRYGSPRSWDQGVVEDPDMVYANGSFYLLFSGGYWGNDSYAEGYAICTSPTACTTNARSGELLATGTDGLHGPGGASWFQDASGYGWLALHSWSGTCTASSPTNCYSLSYGQTRELSFIRLNLGPLPVINSFTASPTTLSSGGGRVTFSVTSPLRTSYSISSSPSIPGLRPNTPYATVPANTTASPITYTFTVTTINSGGTETDTTSVTVAAVPPVIQSFSASPSSLPYTGGSVTLTASASNTTSYTFTSSPIVSGLPITVHTTGSAHATVTLPANDTSSTESYTFTVMATGPSGLQSSSQLSVSVAAGSGETFFVDASRSDTIAEWSWNTTAGWHQTFFYGDQVAAGTSPSAVLVNGSAQIFFVDASRSDTIAEWSWNTTAGWHQTFFYGDQVAAGTSPSAVLVNGSAQIFFVDASRGDTIAEWSWNTTAGWHQTFFYGDQVAAGTSPSAVLVNGSAQIFFVDASRGDTIAEWSWNTTAGWHQTLFYGDQVAAGTSPSAVLVNGSAQIFFVDASRSDTIAEWSWNTTAGWHQTFFYGDQVAAGTSPSAVLVNGSAQIFFVDASRSDTIAEWSWNTTAGWHQTFFYGDQVAAGTSPSAVVV